jgi:ABC-2 type transport system permease protein
MGELRVYATVARLAFRRQSTYRGAMLASLFTNVVFGYIVAALMRAIAANGKTIGGWSQRDLVTFAFATQSILGLISAFGERELAQRVLTGDIATDLTRPVHLEGWTIAQFYGKASAQMIVRCIPTFASGYVLFDLRLPNVATAVATVVAMLLAMLVAASWWMVVNLTTFWLIDAKGTIQFANIITYVFSGIAFPLVLLAPGARGVVRSLPWASLVQLPVEVFIGKHQSVGGLAGTYGRQLLWALTFIALAHIMIVKGRRKVVVQGG